MEPAATSELPDNLERLMNNTDNCFFDAAEFSLPDEQVSAGALPTNQVEGAAAPAEAVTNHEVEGDAAPAVIAQVSVARSPLYATLCGVEVHRCESWAMVK